MMKWIFIGFVLMLLCLSASAQNPQCRTLALGTSTPECASTAFVTSGIGTQSRVATQFDKSNTSLANVTGLTAAVSASQSYRFEAVLHVTADAIGGHKYAIAGTATATAIVYAIVSLDNGAPGLLRITSRQSALGGAAGQAGQTSYLTRISGLVTVNAGGTLTVQFAQNAANGTSSVLSGSTLSVVPVQ